MAVRTPYRWDGSSIIEMTSANITSIIQRCVYLHGASSSRAVDLTVVGSSGSLRRMLDTRDTAGAESSNNTSFGNNSPAATNDRGASTTYDRISETVNTTSQPTDTNSRTYPIYAETALTADPLIFRSMSTTDMLDTFIKPAIDLLIDGSDRDGTYRIHTATSLSNHTLISGTPVFTDQRFNTAFHGLSAGATATAELLPASVDQPSTISNYYLFRTNQGVSVGTPSHVDPLVLDSGNNLDVPTQAEFDTILTNLMNFATSSLDQYRLRYEVHGVSGSDANSLAGEGIDVTPQQRGSSMLDTTLNSSVRINDQDADVYRSQRFPAGSSETETTYALKIFRT